MDNDQLYTFQVVYKFLNYSKAAEQLNVTQPTVTARIQNLETELGCKLFHRVGKRLLISEEGKSFYTYTEKILSYMKEAKETVTLLQKPSIKVGFAPGFSTDILINTVNQFQKVNQCSLFVIEGEDTTEISDLVLKGELDVGFVRNANTSQELITEDIYDDKVIFIVSPSHPFAHKEKITKNDLHTESLICYRRNTPLWLLIDEKLVGVENLHRIEVNSFEMIKSFVKNGWGFSIIPATLLSELEDTSKFCIKSFEDISYIPNKINSIYKRDTPNMHMIHLFIDSFKTILNTSTVI